MQRSATKLLYAALSAGLLTCAQPLAADEEEQPRSIASPDYPAAPQVQTPAEAQLKSAGCLSCHKYLPSRTEGNPKAFLPHRQYFQQSDSPPCVECHQHVGHDKLGHHLEDFGWKKPDGVTP